MLALVPLLLVKACRWADAHPSDREMLAEFQDNRAIFSDLLKMIGDEKRVTRIGDNFIWIDGMTSVSGTDRPRYLPDDRLKRYRALFKALKLESGVIRHDDGSVGFIRSSSGIVTSGSSKEFIWSKHIGDAVMPPSDKRTLEDACIPKTGCRSIRRIAPEWYIAFDSN
ncbi:MAG: hypothetical protein CVT74_03610 [Alphaproteobacteria bacterium HGW-Alphaproteobacteria-13]|nr:MAG: hypothetical protein CVT74_03610 [Alphaproteobacteria bacterium HGW-Alphaproteobacteria-13]